MTNEVSSIPREIICINIGQAGVQLSNAAWELFCIEHGIQACGKLSQCLDAKINGGFQTFFEEVRGSRYVPRCVSIDLEPTVLDEVRCGPYRDLFHPDQLISSIEDAANNYARGFHTRGKCIIDDVIDRVRKISHNCENLQGFIIMNSFGGGTGSGFTSLLLTKMGLEFAKHSKFQLAIYPGTQLATSVVEPYNTVMSMQSTKDLTDVTILMDNESIYDICGLALDISKPSFNNLNRLIAQIFSSVTVSLRFQNALNSDLVQLVTNLVPYPAIHFPLANFSPILSESRAEHQDMSTRDITRTLFEPFCQMVRCNVAVGRYMSCCLQYRGDVNPRDTNEAILEIKNRNDVQFVDWCPTGFKLSISSQPPIAVPGSQMAQTCRSVTMLANSSAITQVFNEITRKFDVLFAKRAFVHWYVSEGLEEGEFVEVRSQVLDLQKDYEEISSMPEDQGEESRYTGSAFKEQTIAREEENIAMVEENVEENESNKETVAYEDDSAGKNNYSANNASQLGDTDDNDEENVTENTMDFEDIF